MDIELIKQQIKSIKWKKYKTAYGVAKDVPKDLIDLFSPNLDIACHALFNLETKLCHQHVFVSSAAVPAFPFILEALDSNNELTVDILELLLGFARCTCPKRKLENEDWVNEIWANVANEKSRFEKYMKSDVKDIREYAELLLTHIEGRCFVYGTTHSE